MTPRPAFSAILLCLMGSRMVAVAQEQPKPWQLNVPYRCPDGITYTITKCVPASHGREICYWREEHNGQLVVEAYSLSTQMDGRLRPCKVGSSAQTQPAHGTNSQATNPPYLIEMPSVDHVKSEIQGTSPDDTLARQVAVFTYLPQIVTRMQDPHRSYSAPNTPDEQRIIGAYNLAAYQMSQAYAKSHTPEQAKEFERLHGRYEMDAKFEDQWFNQLFSPEFRAAYHRAVAGRLADYHAHVARQQAAGSEQAGGSGHPAAQDGLQALQQLTQGLSEILTSSVSSLPAAEPGAAGYATAASNEEAKQQWQRALSKSDTFESSDEFVLMFFGPGAASMMCHGNLLVGEKPYTVESQNGRVVLSFFKGEAGASQAWLLGLRQDGALVSQNARTLQLFGKEESKHKPCGVDVLKPKPRTGASASTTPGAKPTQPGAQTLKPGLELVGKI